MGQPEIFVVLPYERRNLSERARAAGAQVIIDCTCARGAELPDGVWVRAVDSGDAPGSGPLIVRRGPPVAGRSCWRELASWPESPAELEGFEGVVLRGLGSGGWSGERELRELIAAAPQGVRVLADWPHGPDEPRPQIAGILLSDVLFHSFAPPPGLVRRRERLRAADLLRVGGQNVVASPASPVWRRLAAGESVETVGAGWFEADDPFLVAWPGGAGLLHAAREPRLETALSPWMPAPARATVSLAGPDTRPGLRSAAQESTVDAGVTTGELIAVVGLGCRLPEDVDGPELLWQRLNAGWSAIGEVPKSRWDSRLFYDADKSAPDRTYTRIGAFIRNFSFNPRRFRIPPSSVPYVDPIQQMTLEAAADALADAGYEKRAFDRTRTAVILGNSMGGEITDAYVLRSMVPALQDYLGEVPDFATLGAEARKEILHSFAKRMTRDLPQITEDSMPGELSNVVAGRVAYALDLGGPNFTTDAACASSMAAIQSAMTGLRDGDFDLAITGGADRSMGVATYIKFCKIGALSPDGSRPFDAGANGFVMGEGVGVLVLKRLNDAVRDQDKIYAVIRSMGASSDGKGKGITAPNVEGQKRALTRAWEGAGVDPWDLDLVECHGTSTTVGDRVEVEALTALIGSGRRERPVRIGSIKSNVGHLKSAAGAAAMLKTVLSLHHQQFVPSINYEKARTDLALDVVPLRVQTRPERWESSGPRFAGVSAFGFGGTNFHAVLQGFTPGMAPARLPRRVRDHGDGAAVALGTGGGEPPVGGQSSGGAGPSAGGARMGGGMSGGHGGNNGGGAGGGATGGGLPVPEGIWAASADTPEALIRELKAIRDGRSTVFEPDAALRVAAAAADNAERNYQIERAIAGLEKGGNYDLLRQRGIHLEDVPSDGQLAMLFTGQGSQYLDMGLDLAPVFRPAGDTFREADEVMTPLLGRPLTEYIRRNPLLAEDAQFEALRATEISQPATLAVDVAILRVLASYGVFPDVVAGHSLGEYAAAVAAGVLSFRDALLAVSARGREMAAVKLDDFGKMASIAAPPDVIHEVLAQLGGYVIPANKNAPNQTVIAGESAAVDAALELFKARGITVFPLPVSHAFHSRIVAPASAPLRRVLEGLDVQAPRRRITTNVTGRYYPTGDGAARAAVDILTQQVAAPVEWTDQIERMYNDGARIFVECGPKRALSGFVVSILRHRPHRALFTNQPKRGGVLSLRDSLAALFVLGFPVRPTPTEAVELFAAPGPRRSGSTAVAARVARLRSGSPSSVPALHSVERDILALVSNKTGYPLDALDLDAELEADLGIDSVKMADIVAAVQDYFQLGDDPSFRTADYRTLRSVVGYAVRRIAITRPAPGESAVVSPEVATSFLQSFAHGSLGGALDSSKFAQAMLPALDAFLKASWSAYELARVATPQRPSAPQPGAAVPAAARAPVVVPPAPAPDVERPLSAAPASARPPAPVGDPRLVAVQQRFYAGRIVCSGAAVGLPGGDEVFGPDNIRRILRGENRIGAVPHAVQDRLLGKQIVRLVKDPQTGDGRFVPVEDHSQVIRLAGQKAHFDLADYGVDPEVTRALDITTQLAFAAGLEALRDAGIPLVRTFRKTGSGKNVATGWALPESYREGTGIVFASAFPGYDQLLQKVKSDGGDGEGRFDRRFLFQVLSMGHSQLAQLIGARGPNTQVNAACASTSQAISVAEDWLRTGRCTRVLVVAADDVTGDNLIEWIGAGFLAAGAATTEDKVENAALPFDRRRHGMILGMGAVGMMIETEASVRERGLVPVAELLGTQISNSAFHGTRLDAQHITQQVTLFAQQIAEIAGTDPASIARSAVFLSHETFTPARGGSAAAEMAALPAAFGPDASRMIIANTKGFTGHAMGAGLEDAVAVKALQYREVPPIPNLREPDPELGDLRLSTGGPADFSYAIRLAAGFGSQLALVAWRRMANGDQRVASEATRRAWLMEQTGSAETVVEHRQLRSAAVPAAVETPAVSSTVQATTAAATTDSSQPGAARPAVTPAMLDTLIAVVAEKTGYDVADLDPSYELEADLGIDTVKQAEIFSIMRDRYRIPRDDRFRLADHKTLTALAAWLAGKAAEAGTAPGAASPVAPPTPPTEPDVAPTRESAAAARELDGAGSEDVVGTGEGAPGGGTPELTVGRDGGVARGPDGAPAVETLDPASSADERAAAVPTGGDDASDETRPPESEPDGADTRHLAADSHAGGLPAARAEGRPRIADGYEDPEIFEMIRPQAADAEGQAAGLGPLVERVVPSELIAPVDPRTPEYVVEGAEEDKDTRTADGGEGESGEDVGVFVDDDSAPETTAETPAEGAEARGLPRSFRLRRVARISRYTAIAGFLQDRVFRVMGSGALADALRRELGRRGGGLDGDPDVVIDVGVTIQEAFAEARRLDGRPPTWWICVEQEDAELSVERAAAVGARAGLTKALGREWTGCQARVISLDPWMEPTEAARAVLNELTAGDRSVEVWLGPERREVAVLGVADFPGRHQRLAGGVALLTGGTRGITARVAGVLAARGVGTLILAARTAPGTSPLNEEQARARARAEIEQAGERATPRRIEDLLRPQRLADEARQTVERLRSLGAVVEVYTVDLAALPAVQGLVRELVSRYGHIDYCVHGAGVEESRRLADKDEAAFQRVFSAKARGGVALAEALPASTRFLSMGSIAGRFGNASQVDYAAANEAMARVCAQRPNSLHVAWTAWDETGMAVRGGMERLLTERGIELLPAGPGAELAADLLASAEFGEVVAAAALGDFQMPSFHPLLDELRMDGDAVIGRRLLTTSRDAWLSDHVINDTPVLPGVMGLELMAAVALAVNPRGRYLGAEELRFNSALKLHHDEPVQVEVRGEPRRDGSVYCVLRSSRTTRTGREIHTDHFEAVIQTEAMPLLPRMPESFNPSLSMDRGDIYLRFFHGEVFQVLENLEGASLSGAEVGARVQQASIAEGLFTDPLVLEAVFQATGLHRMMQLSVMALPATVQAVARLRPVMDDLPLTVIVIQRGEVYDIDVESGDTVMMRVRGFRMVDTGPLEPELSIAAPEEGWLSTAVANAAEAKAALSDQERSEFTRRGVAKRQDDRLAGQLAARAAVERLCGHTDFQITRLLTGEPEVVGVKDVRVSLAHQAGDAVAVAVSGGSRVGVDMEMVVSRDPSFALEWFDPIEKVDFSDDLALTFGWAVKEAVLKALGRGLALSPRDVLLDLGPPLVVTLRGGAAARLEELGGGKIVVRSGQVRGRVVATVVIGGGS